MREISPAVTGFESPPGYHDKPRSFPLLSLPEKFSSVDLTDIVETCLDQTCSLFNGIIHSACEIFTSIEVDEMRVDHGVVDVPIILASFSHG